MIYLGIVQSFCAAECTIPQTIADAKETFARMSAHQMSEVNIQTLTPTQLAAFKELSTELFHSEIASHKCSSQAKRAKAQIMYQKIGELYSNSYICCSSTANG